MVQGFTDLDGSRTDAWRCVGEAQDAGKPAEVTGCRRSLAKSTSGSGEYLI